jgi:hypothetical protein
LRNGSALANDLLMNCIAPFDPDPRRRNSYQIETAGKAVAVRERQLRAGTSQIIRDDKTERAFSDSLREIAGPIHSHGRAVRAWHDNERFAGLSNEIKQSHSSTCALRKGFSEVIRPPRISLRFNRSEPRTKL